MNLIPDLEQRICQWEPSNSVDMRWFNPWMMLALAGGWSATASAQLELVADPQMPAVCAGDARNIATVWHNAGDQAWSGEISAQIFQASSATAVPLGTTRWKYLEVLPRQTVLESARLDFPAVRAETKFIVRWVAETNRVLGTTSVMVYPTNLLGELKSLCRGDDLGLLDPNDELKPMFKQNGVEFLNLGETALEDFHGKLAVIGPFHSSSQMREGLAHSLRKIAAAGVAVVWLPPPPDPQAEITPSFYIVPVGKGAIVIVQPELVADFSKNPGSQLNLVHCCKLALNPEPFSISQLAQSP
jgi:hypothetical protein